MFSGDVMFVRSSSLLMFSVYSRYYEVNS